MRKQLVFFFITAIIALRVSLTVSWIQSAVQLKATKLLKLYLILDYP